MVRVKFSGMISASSPFRADAPAVAGGHRPITVRIDDVFGYDIETPNFDRLADRAAVFDSYYGGSMPTLPARREYLTGVQ